LIQSPKDEIIKNCPIGKIEEELNVSFAFIQKIPVKAFF
jgi:hypothetical protein